jgi:transcriptional regulator with XRE-family HTH domain
MIDGSTLRRLRCERGWTQAQLADLVDIPTSVLSAYEHGRRVPSVTTASRIVDALGYRIDLVPRPDPIVQGQRLEQVLHLAEALPYKPRAMPRARR